MKSIPKVFRNFSILFVILLLSICLIRYDKLSVKKNIPDKFSDYYALGENGVDVLFLGSSHTMSAISPMDLWEEFGISGYNMSIPACRIPTNYWILRNALQYSTPKLVVLETSFLDDEKANINFAHNFFDNVPFSRLKIEAAFDLFDGNLKQISEILFPILRFHGRWKELFRDDFDMSVSYLMGYSGGYETQKVELPEQSVSDPDEVDTVGTEYLYKIIDLCKEKNIALMFYDTPFFDVSQNDSGFIALLSEKLNIPHYSPDDILKELNTGTDFNDPNHINYSGALKTTRLLGNFISEKFGFENNRNNEAYRKWDDSLEEYMKIKEKEFLLTGKLPSYLTKCFDDDFSYIIEILDPKIVKDDYYRGLLMNIGMDPDSVPLNERFLFILRDNRQIFLLKDHLSENTDPFETPIGNGVFLQKREEDQYQLLIENEILYTSSYSEIKDACIRITVLQNETNQVIESGIWKLLPEPDFILVEETKR